MKLILHWQETYIFTGLSYEKHKNCDELMHWPKGVTPFKILELDKLTNTLVEVYRILCK